MWASGAIQALNMKVLMQINFVAEFHRQNIGELRGNVCDSSLASWKARNRLPIGYNCTFLLALTAEALMRRNRLLLMGWVTLGLNIRLKGYVYRQYLYTVR